MSIMPDPLNVSSVIRSEALRLQVEEAALRAVIEVEGQAVDLLDNIQDGMVDGRVMIRWEGHYFWRYLPRNLRSMATAEGLANSRAGAVKNPRSMAARHEMLQRAMAIHEDAALKSISMGVGQVMGANYAMVGYPSVQAMWEDAQTLAGQVRMMIKFIEASKLVDELQRLDWAGFARVYNGPSYARYQYDTKMAEAYLRHGGTGQPYVARPGWLRVGDSRHQLVRDLQTRLDSLGYHVNIDGDFGPDTKAAVQLFQLEHNLEPDGIVGPKTETALTTAAPRRVQRERAEASTEEVAARVPEVKTGKTIRDVAIGGTTLVGALKAIEESGALTALQTIQGALGPAGALLDFIADHWWVLVLITGLAIAFWAQKIVRRKVVDFREGRVI